MSRPTICKDFVSLRGTPGQIQRALLPCLVTLWDKRCLHKQIVSPAKCWHMAEYCGVTPLLSITKQSSEVPKTEYLPPIKHSCYGLGSQDRMSWKEAPQRMDCAHRGGVSSCHVLLCQALFSPETSALSSSSCSWQIHMARLHRPALSTKSIF